MRLGKEGAVYLGVLPDVPRRIVFSHTQLEILLGEDVCQDWSSLLKNCFLLAF